jgi:hypothetical protein
VALSQLEEFFRATDVNEPLMKKGNKGLYHRILKDQISRPRWDAFPDLSICKNLKPPPKAK